MAIQINKYLDFDFQLVGQIDPIKDHAGVIIGEFPQSRYKNYKSTPLNKYGTGPFCRFQIAKKAKTSGIYLIKVNQTVLYVGECENLAKRFSSNGYGGISPRNCFVGGQETNCRINNLIYLAFLQEQQLSLWFYQTDFDKYVRRELENNLIRLLKPVWNR
jgi:hypothetical protein